MYLVLRTKFDYAPCLKTSNGLGFLFYALRQSNIKSGQIQINDIYLEIKLTLMNKSFSIISASYLSNIACYTYTLLSSSSGRVIFIMV
jgi:hypothetical protein